METAFEAIKNSDDVSAMVRCIRERMKVATPNKEAICFYTGFRPNNIINKQQMEQSLIDDGYTLRYDGNWEKKESVLDDVQVSVFTNEYQELIARY